MSLNVCALLGACDGDRVNSPAGGRLAPTPLSAIELHGQDDSPTSSPSDRPPEKRPRRAGATASSKRAEEPQGSAASHERALGSFELTYYWVAKEGRGKRTRTLYNKKCKPLAKVTRRFARQLRLEGTGRLRDGRLVTTAGGCRCAKACYWIASRRHRWGAGVAHRPLSPFRSIAVDTAHVSIGQTLYVPELDGLTMPGAAPHGGFVHDGCVIADDRGGGVRGRKIDFFTARKSHYRALFARHGIKQITAYSGDERCQALAKGKRPELAASSTRGSI